MPNRVIKESIRTSKKVNALSDFEFRLWLYLITYVDDYGRGSADPELIKNLVFPRRKGITEQQIQKALDSLANTGMVILYEYDEEPFLYFPNWDQHQRIQSKKSKFPDPQDGSISPPSTVSHGEEPPRARVLNPIQIQSNTNPIDSTEPQAPSVLTLTLNDGSEYPITQADVEEWQTAFPNADVMQQLLAMKLWCKDNPKKRKTKNGIRRFVTNWLDREQNRGGYKQNVPQQQTAPSAPPPDASTYRREPTAEEMRQLRERMGYE